MRRSTKRRLWRMAKSAVEHRSVEDVLALADGCKQIRHEKQSRVFGDMLIDAMLLRRKGELRDAVKRSTKYVREGGDMGIAFVKFMDEVAPEWRSS